jgi:5-methylcytosine-specific restriction endonuclease McrA
MPIKNGATYEYKYKNLKCLACGVIFDSKTRNWKQKYCSRRCSSKNVRHKNWFTAGGTPWNKHLKGYRKGYIMSEETKRKIGIANTKKIHKSTVNQLIRKSHKYREWREEVFKRDNYMCQKCGDKSMAGHRLILHAHHIKWLSKYPNLVYYVDNGVTLCVPCHRKQHPNIKCIGIKKLKI